MRRCLCAMLAVVIAPLGGAFAQDSVVTVEDVFSSEYRTSLVMEIEAAIAEAQAEHGIISEEAAREIRRTASLDHAPLDQIAAEYDVVRHRMVALLNVWRRSLGAEAGDALHLGVTTVDIFDTLRILQLKKSIALLRRDLLDIEAQLVALADEHRATPMAGRTLGQHALPITFGKKVAVWAAANRRSVERLNEVECRLDELGVLRGAVGTHLGLGPKGREVERHVAHSLGLGPTAPADWHGMRDVFGEYAAALAILSRVYASIGQEIFTLQMTDIGEVYEARPGGAVSSSSMPHKRNPSRSEALVHAGRVIPATAQILIDDVANAFERDNTSRPNRVLKEISLDATEMTGDMATLLDRLVVDKDRMARNLRETDGMIMAQRIVLFLQDEIGKEHAEERVAAAARTSLEQGRAFADILLEDPELGPLLTGRLEHLLDPEGYLGLSAEQVDDTISWLEARSPGPRCKTAGK